MTIKALKESIEIWQSKLLEEDPINIGAGPSACPLCAVYYKKDCAGCPVSNATNFPLCAHTPYTKAIHALDVWRLDEMVSRYQKVKDYGRDIFRSAAREEIAFLEGLLTEALQTPGEKLLSVLKICEEFVGHFKGGLSAHQPGHISAGELLYDIRSEIAKLKGK